MNKIVLFAIVSVPVILLSWRSLMNVRSHGFVRFFGWECIVWLAISNFRYWFQDALSVRQLISWLCLIIGTYMVLAGAIELRGKGKASSAQRKDNALYGFEKTTNLVDTGIYRHIRHPLYSSLIWLTWGIYLKNATLTLLFVALLATIFFYITALKDEQECMVYFGDEYKAYRKRSRMFIPYIF